MNFYFFLSIIFLISTVLGDINFTYHDDEDSEYELSPGDEDNVGECLEIEKKLGYRKCVENDKGKAIKIQIERSDIKEISSYKSITELHIKGGKISQADINKIKLPNLEKIYFMKCSFDEDVKSFKNFDNIKRITFFATVLKTLPEGIYSIKSLEELVVESAEIGSLSKNIGNLKNLKALDLPFNKIKKLPKEISKLENLEYLNLKSNGIKDISSINSLSNLKYLFLGENEISEFPIKDLKKLEKLNISYNKLKKFPKEIGNFKNLKTLSLEGNKIDDEIPESYNSLLNLEIFNVGENYNISGKALTNPKLKYCTYEKKYNICIVSDVEYSCFDEDYHFKTCKSTSTKKTTTTKTKANSSLPTSTNGKCGKDYGVCPSSQCCSKYGYCGTSEKHCGSGCQSEFGKCGTTTEIKISTNGKCGKENGKCPSGQCCSKYGYCGTSEKYCGSGCQSEFGQCGTTTEIKISTNGKCGKENGKCPSGQCCSKYGYCGTSEKHCSTGCQSQFGKCN